MRVSVEWTLGKIIGLWKFVNDPMRMKILLSPVARWISVAALLTNVHTCYYGSIVSQYFNCEPPTAREYLATQPQN